MSSIKERESTFTLYFTTCLKVFIFLATNQDNDGYITLDELAVTMSDLGHTDLTPSQLLDMMREADLDKDGKISFVEFKILLKT